MAEVVSIAGFGY